jgi:cytochrome P450
MALDRGGTVPAVPHFDIDLETFWADPYPTYARLRREAPVAFAPQLGAVLLTRRDDVFHWEKEIDTFSSDQPGGLMNQLMGQNMMRKDGAAHMAERKVYFQAVSPRTVADVWTSRFQAHCDRLLDALIPKGRADLVEEFALPFSGECLKEMTGLTNITAAEMDAWSQALIEGIANYAGDPAVEQRCHAATAGIDAAIDDMLPVVRHKPNHSLLSVMLHGGLPEQQVRANVRLTISGGQNEPRKAIAGCVWALLTHPDQFDDVRAGRISWLQVLDEYLRWQSPIGMSPRRVAKPADIRGVRIEPEQRAFLMFAAANHDEACFEEADRFIAARDTTKAIAFGAGPHFCAGAWAARAMVADVVLPTLFRRVKGLRLSGTPRIGGWAFRGLLDLPMAWDVEATAAG